MRWLTSLLLGAGILGCSNAPTRESTGPSYVDEADGAPRAHLHIPAEYVPLLDWDPEAFVDDPETDVIEEEPEEEAAPVRRTSRARTYERRWYGSRRARRLAARRFRTTGLSVSVSRGGGHPVGRPGHAVGVPSQAIGVPGQAVGRPGQAVEIPGQAAGLPGQAVRLPGQSVGLPEQAVGLPGQAVNLPGQAVSLPSQPVGLPGQAVGVPGQPLRSVPQRSKAGRKKSKDR